MKIFISHSSKDKWTARRIAEDIEAIGHEVFIDEKDIKTGQSIDSEIRLHLSDSDHFLVLLSPASIKSEWVLLELGGAMTLKKEIMPILLYVGVNDVPKAINLKLARDINDISKYYDELKNRSGTATSVVVKKKSPAKEKSPKQKFNVGDKVKIIAKPPDDALRDTGLSIAWDEEMETYLGELTEISHVSDNGVVSLKIDTGHWGWAPEWLLRYYT